jgi:hypothetical protein
MKFKNNTINEIVTGAKYGIVFSLVVGLIYGLFLYGPLTGNDPIKMIIIPFLTIPMGVFAGIIGNIFLSFAHFKEHPYKKSRSEEHDR